MDSIDWMTTTFKYLAIGSVYALVAVDIEKKQTSVLYTYCIMVIIEEQTFFFSEVLVQ